MGLAHAQHHLAVLLVDRLDTWQRMPSLRRARAFACSIEFHLVTASQALDQLRRAAGRNQAAVVDNGNAVAKPLRLVHVMRGQQDGAAAALKLTDDVPKLAAALRVETGGGFVEKEYLGIGYQRCGDRQALPLTARQLPDPTVGLFGQRHFLHNLRGRARTAIEAGEKLQGLPHRKFIPQARLLQRDSQHLAQLLGVGTPGLSDNLDLAGSRRKQPLQNFDGGRLPGAVWAEQAKTFAGLDLQIESAYGLDLSLVGLAQIATANHQIHVLDHKRIGPLPSTTATSPGLRAGTLRRG